MSGIPSNILLKSSLNAEMFLTCFQRAHLSQAIFFFFIAPKRIKRAVFSSFHVWVTWNKDNYRNRSALWPIWLDQRKNCEMSRILILVDNLGKFVFSDLMIWRHVGYVIVALFPMLYRNVFLLSRTWQWYWPISPSARNLAKRVCKVTTAESEHSTSKVGWERKFWSFALFYLLQLLIFQLLGLSGSLSMTMA